MERGLQAPARSYDKIKFVMPQPYRFTLAVLAIWTLVLPLGYAAALHFVRQEDVLSASWYIWAFFISAYYHAVGVLIGLYFFGPPYRRLWLLGLTTALTIVPFAFIYT